VATGVQGNANASGFLWPEGGIGVWKFDNCVAHNNRVNGIFTWQNTALAHVVARFVGYHNGQAGIEHGAYINGYVYEDSILFGNGEASVRVHALSPASPQLMLDNLWCDGAGIAAHGVELVKHELPSRHPILIARSVFANHRVAAVALLATEGPADCVDVVACEIEDQAIFATERWVGGTVRLGDSQRGAVLVLPAASAQGPHSSWHTSVPTVDFARPLPAPDRRAIALAFAAPLTASSRMVEGDCVAGGGAGPSFAVGTAPGMQSAVHDSRGHRTRPADEGRERHLRAKLRRGRGRRSHLAFVVVENPGQRATVELFAGDRRVKRAKVRRGRSLIAVRYRKLRGKTVRLRHGADVVARWKLPLDRRRRPGRRAD
jgi:hypothetical protein